MSHPRKCAPSLLNNPSVAPLSFQGFKNRMDRKSQRPIVSMCHLGNQFPIVLTHGENYHEPENPLLQ
jgi:hypothetical protein